MKTLGLVVLEKNFFYVFPMTPPYGPQGHGRQDLFRGPLYIATHKNMKALGLVVSEKKIF